MSGMMDDGRVATAPPRIEPQAQPRRSRLSIRTREAIDCYVFMLPAILGLILFCREIPLVVFLLVGGVLADRIPRNKVMMSANVVSAFAQAATAALLITGNAEVWHLAALAAVNGGASAFFFPASAGVSSRSLGRAPVRRRQR